MVPLLVRAGATITEEHADYSCYLRACLDAGGVRAYERQHRTTLANILNRGDRLPTDVIPKIVDFWAHLGWYEYSVPGTGPRAVATGPEESSSS